MTALSDAINRFAASLAEQGDWQGVAEVLNTPSQDARIQELRTTRWLMTELSQVIDPATGATIADQVLAALQSSDHPRVKAAYQAMNAGGLDLSDPQVQTMIGVIGQNAGWSSELIDSLKGAGFDRRSPAQMAGFPDVSAATCESHYKAANAIAADDFVYDSQRVMLCFNGPLESASFTLRVRPSGTVNGVEVVGACKTIVGNSSLLAGREADLLNGIKNLVAGYLEAS